MLYGDAQAIIADLVTVNRRLVAALRWAADPTALRQFRGIVDHCDEAIRVIEAIEARLADGRGPEAMVSEDAATAIVVAQDERKGT